MNGISPELDKKLADMIRNHPGQIVAAEANAQAQQSLKRTQAAIEGASKVKVSQEALDNAAKASAKAKALFSMFLLIRPILTALFTILKI